MLKFYNTLTRKKEAFKPIRKKTVHMYNCGPTVYDYAHVGNFRSFLLADLARRVLEFNDYRVKQVMNITDVGHLVSDADEGEDKMERSAHEQRKSIWEIADMFTAQFVADSNKLHIKKPSHRPRATDHIKEQIALVQELEKKGFTYVAGDGVYFDTSKDPGYGKLAGQALADKQAGARVGVNQQKRNNTDFALWKFSPASTDKAKRRQMEWESPWTAPDGNNMGFPGWHIECSAMSAKYLGTPFDIHTGGIDHIPVHHTNEIAQTENATGKTMAHYWLHSEFLNMRGDKMAKSAGNFVRIGDIEERGYSPLAYRLLVMQSHYRSQMQFSWDAIKQAQETLDGLYEFLLRLKTLCKRGGKKISKIKTLSDDTKRQFLAHVNDDLDTPRAVAVMFGYIREINARLDAGAIACKDAPTVRNTIEYFDEVLGVLDQAQIESLTKIPQDIQRMITEREKMRSAKDFSGADKIRAILTEQGYEIRDTSLGPIVKRDGKDAIKKLPNSPARS